jgi:pimeloyl-ACP methyl ester carboxylesterase
LNKKTRIIFKHEDGIVEGVYCNAGSLSPLVIIINGHNGFYNYGMFPYIQEDLLKNNVSSFSFNFSHGGIIGDGDYFEDLEKYEMNCMRLETEDLLCILHNLHSDKFDKHSKTILLTHSLGGVPTIFGAKKAIEENLVIDGIILISSVKTLDFWPREMIKEWAMAGVFYKKNNRTKQELPQGFEFLQEVLKSNTTWNVEPIIKSLPIPILIIHGEKDESVPLEHGESLYNWVKDLNPKATFKVISNATHTYNTKHPFEGASVELIELLDTICSWVQRLP